MRRTWRLSVPLDILRCVVSEWLTARLARSISGLVLDVGCGQGRHLPTGAIGIDVDADRLRVARERSARVAVADARLLPFADGRFDTVLAIRMLNATGAIDETLREIRRVLAPAGRLLVYTRARRADEVPTGASKNDRLDADNGLERLRRLFPAVTMEREPGEERGALFLVRLTET